jgi:CHAT domain-containing protein
MRLSSPTSWRMVALQTATLAMLWFGVLSQRDHRAPATEADSGPAGDGRVVQGPPASYEVRRSSIALEALVAARKEIARSPALAAAHFHLAVALEQLGLTPEARAEFENAAALESDVARSAEARRRARALRNSGPVAASIAAARYIRATASPESRTVLQEYREARERTHDRSLWNRADGNARLETAAKLYERGVSSPEPLPRVFSQVAAALSPRDQVDLYMQRYLIAGGLHRERRSDEAIALLRTLDADVFRVHGQAGLRAQIVCEQAIHGIVRGSPVEVLDLLRDAFHASAANGESRLAALYANLAGEIRSTVPESPSREVCLCNPLNGPPKTSTKSRAREDRKVKFGAFLEALEICRDVGCKDVGHIAPPEKPHGEAQRALRPDAAIIEYATVRDQVLAFVIRKDDAHAVFLYASAEDLKKAADAMRRADDRSFAVAAGRLYELIFPTVEALLEGVSTIAFIPSPDLAGIPFGALYDVHRDRYLIERVAVVHAQSAHAAIAASRALKPPHKEKTLAIAATEFDRERYPDASALPGARREADSIAELSGCSRLLVGPAATAEAVRRQLVENAVIHYAGHIVRRGADVWLPLMPAGGCDGLSATEIARLPLKDVRVVVLAACRGASPDETDDVMPTMADAFLTAGVSAVIASAYDVDDADAPATMHRLHTYLRDGDDPADALRKTAIDELGRRNVPLSLRFMATGGAVSLAHSRK